MPSTKNLQIANIIGLIAVLVLNTLAVTLPLAGRNTGEISDLYPNLFVPAGYAFSIWSVIYILLIIFIVLQAKGLFKKDQPAPDFVGQIGWWFVVSCVANSLWIVAWHNLLVSVSLLLMLLILFSLVQIYQRINNGGEVPFLVKLPFSIYLGWITVATVANVTAVLVASGWSGWGVSEINWTVIVLITASLIAALVVWTRKDWAYLLVIIWAFYAIVVKRQAVGNPDETIIITTIYVALAFLILLLLARIFLLKRT
jgi:hypothetical protein